jgi:hypothetical protein
MYSKEETAERIDRASSGGESLTDQESATIFGDTQRILDQIDFTREDREAYMEDLTDGYAAQDGIPTEAEINGTTTDQNSTDLYLSAMAKISAEGYDPDGSNLSAEEQSALYGSRGQTPNAAESAYLNDLLSDATHNEDSTVLDVNGNPLYKAGDNVTPQTFWEQAGDLAIGLVDTFFNPLSLFGDKFTIAGANAAFVEKQLEAYKNGGTFVYGDDGKTVTGVAAPNYDASGDNENDTVVFYDENGEIQVTGDGVAITDIDETNDNIIEKKKEGGDDIKVDEIKIIDSNTEYTNTEDGVVETSVEVEEPVIDEPVDDPPEDEPVIDEPVVDTGYTTDADGNIVCNEIGYIYNKASNACVPIGDVSGGGSLGDREIRERKDVTPRDKTTGDTSSVTFRTPKQFAQGGSVTPNIDSFFSNLR